MWIDFLERSKWSILLLLLLLLSRCDRRDVLRTEIPVPFVRVAVDLNGEGASLREPMNYLVLSKPYTPGEHLGYSGLIVVHGFDITSSMKDGVQPYYAYDRICPHEWPRKVAIQMKVDEATILQAQCPVCGTTYDLSMGTGHPTQGIGKVPLLSYRVLKKENALYVTSH